MAEPVRRSINIVALLRKLELCAYGRLTLKPDQLKAIEILLRKALPDLQAVEIREERGDLVTVLASLRGGAVERLSGPSKPLNGAVLDVSTISNDSGGQG